LQEQIIWSSKDPPSGRSAAILQELPSENTLDVRYPIGALIRNFWLAKGLTDDIVRWQSVMTRFVYNFAPEFDFLAVWRDSLATRRYLLARSLILLLFLGVLGGSAKAGVDVQNLPATSVGPGLPFAIADLDGDLRPDYASIQTGSNNSGGTDYWLQLHLAAGRQSIRLVAPAGGLVIEARTPSGRVAADLVVTTAWFRQPVAIFLNDGHGSFSRAKLTTFFGTSFEAGTNWGVASDQSGNAVGILPQQSRTAACLKARSLPNFRQHAYAIPVLNAGFPLSSFQISHAGRAPPPEVHYS
jgi:hypothetical protein